LFFGIRGFMLSSFLREDQMTIHESTAIPGLQGREQLIHTLYEAAELEHNLMCTYLYAAFSLKTDAADGLTPDETAAVVRWRRSILDIAIGEMGHLVAVWNITSALGGVPRFGRGNFPLDPGNLPASVVVKLAPFDLATLQHFVYLERPAGSTEPDGEGFEPERTFVRGMSAPRLTPMAHDYETVGAFYERLGVNLRRFADRIGEKDAFCGDPALQLSPSEVELNGAARVICLKTALAAFDAIVAQGEGAPQGTTSRNSSRYGRSTRIYSPLIRPLCLRFRRPAIQCCADRRNPKGGCGSRMNWLRQRSTLRTPPTG
jgi:hypothetical protein